MYIVMKDFSLYGRTFGAGDVFDAAYWPNDVISGLVANGRISEVVVLDDEDEQDETVTDEGYEDDE